MNLSIAGAVLLMLANITSAHAQTKPVKPKPGAAAPAEAPVTEAPAMKPGLWETSIVEQTAKSTDKRTITSRTCYSAEDVKSVERVLPQQRDFGMKCQHREIKAQGSVVTWKLTCSGKEGSSAGPVKMTLGAESYTAQATLDVKTNGKARKVEQNITGKLVGACT